MRPVLPQARPIRVHSASFLTAAILAGDNKLALQQLSRVVNFSVREVVNFSMREHTR